MILMYHKIDLYNPTEWWVTVNAFYRQMWSLQSYEVVTLDDYDPSNPRHVAITFDGVYENVAAFAAPIMKKFGYPFELFIVGDLVGAPEFEDGSEPPAPFCGVEMLRELVGLGGRLQWHTNSHPNLGNVADTDIIERELQIPEKLREIDPDGFKWFAYPHGAFNNLVEEKVSTRFRGALSCVQGDNKSQFKMNRVTVSNDKSFNAGKISCIIASYNYGEFLTEAVESVLRQSILPDEILISDDCSTDETAAIAMEYVARHPNLIKFNRNPENLGIVKHFNKAISLTSGDYVCILGADNRIASNYIEKCAEILESDPSIAISYTDFHLFGKRAKLIYDKYPDDRRGEAKDGFYLIIFPSEKDRDSNRIEKVNFIHGSSMFKRSAYDEVGGYVQRQDRPEDYDLFVRILSKGYRAVKCVETHLEYRQHSSEQANMKHMSAVNLLFYIEKSRRLEAELRKVERSFWRRLFFPVISCKRLFVRAMRLVQKDGMKGLYSRILGRVRNSRNS